MELKFYQSAWQNISFGDVSGCSAYEKQVADSSFYKEFYSLRPQKGASRNESWLIQKKNMSLWIEQTFLRPLSERKAEGLRILSVGAGSGIVEEPWITKGYPVELQECQEESLQHFRESFPHAKIHVCDARRIPVEDAAYDLILLCIMDYVFNREDYSSLLKEICRLLKHDGKAVCISTGYLSLESIAKHIIKGGLGRLGIMKGNGHVLWGWKRTIGEHLRVGYHAGLKTKTLYLLEPSTFLVHRILSPGSPVFLPLHSRIVAVEWGKAS